MGGFNNKLQQILNQFGFVYEFIPSALCMPKERNSWTLNLPDIPATRWRNPNFRLIIHAQDFCHWYKDELCVELHAIENYYPEEYQKQIIFLHWDHNLADYHRGGSENFHVQCVEFPSHSWELVEQLQLRYKDWKSVHRKAKKSYNYLCLNGYPRKHRKEVYNILKNQPKGFLTHNIYQPYQKAPYSNYDFDNVSNFIKLKSLYQQSQSSIVTESIYADSPGIITEKTLLAIAAKHPFMCLGHKNIHKNIEERGFENFDEVFDLDFDIIEQEFRIQAALEINMPVITADDFDASGSKLKAERNYDFLMNDYMKSIEQRAEQQLTKVIV